MPAAVGYRYRCCWWCMGRFLWAAIRAVWLVCAVCSKRTTVECKKKENHNFGFEVVTNEMDGPARICYTINIKWLPHIPCVRVCVYECGQCMCSSETRLIHSFIFCLLSINFVRWELLLLLLFVFFCYFCWILLCSWAWGEIIREKTAWKNMVDCLEKKGARNTETEPNKQIITEYIIRLFCLTFTWFVCLARGGCHQWIINIGFLIETMADGNDLWEVFYNGMWMLF